MYDRISEKEFLFNSLGKKKVADKVKSRLKLVRHWANRFNVKCNNI